MLSDLLTPYDNSHTQHAQLRREDSTYCPGTPSSDTRSIRSSISLPEAYGAFDPLGDAFFEQPFRGNAPHALMEYLSRNHKLFTRPDWGALPYHGRFGYVVQGKGAGKSRCCIEMGRQGVFVIYANLRSGHSDFAFPYGDPIPRQMLLETFAPDEEEYGTSCCAFFAAVFKVFGTELGNLMKDVHDNPVHAVQLWHTRMSGRDERHRARFFSRIKREYTQFMASEHAEPSVGSYRGALELRAVYSWLITTFPSVFDETDTPKVVIVIDEAQQLKQHGSMITNSRSETLCRVIADYSTHAMPASLWVLFTSSDPSVAMFGSTLSFSAVLQEAASNGRDPHKPVPQNLKLRTEWGGLFEPFTALGWDHHALPLGSIKARDVAQMDNLMRFGRPWWYMLSYFPRSLEGHLSSAERAIWPTMNNPISLLLPRYCLHFNNGHVRAQIFLEKSVTDMFSIFCRHQVYGPVWMEVTYPSEPFLANLCATRLHRDELNLVEALRDLYQVLEQGLILAESNCRLESRLLLLSCKDAVAKQLPDISAHRNELTYCRMVPVIDFLEALLGPSCWPLDEECSKSAKSAFANGYINFSHWVTMIAEIGKSRTLEPVPDWGSDDWLLRLWARTTAIQCSEDQPDIDQLIPVYFDTPDEDPTPSTLGSSSSKADSILGEHSRKSRLMSYLLIRGRPDEPEKACSRASGTNCGMNKSEAAGIEDESQLQLLGVRVTSQDF
ncbi:hypothetical protein CERSUDRAFT_96756 [Gelatoporia subvermispora B]|uniref:Uncharacterized protein n=1 Tax=Ceriporiopsis subvermispora (strain B) TaxID=914234 RepID=M2QF09_CERS8|nr:hypothetical protein CERSUDRAFT_96756 [Gelatoporia subvermispora B]